MSARLLGIVVVIVGAAGCSGGTVTPRTGPATTRASALTSSPPRATYSPPRASSLSSGAYRQAAGKLCNFEQQRVYAAEGEFGASGYPESFPSENYAAFYRRTRAITQDLISQLRQLPVPGGSEAEVAKFLDEMRPVVAWVNDLERAVSETVESDYRHLINASSSRDASKPTDFPHFPEACFFFTPAAGAGE